MLEKRLNCRTYDTEVRIVTAVTAGGSVKFLLAVLMSPFSLIFLVFLSPKLLKFGENKGVKFLA